MQALPSHGPAFVPIPPLSNASFSEQTVVQFFKRDGSYWVSNLAIGTTDLDAIYELPASDNVLVVAQGQCYIVDGETQHAELGMADDIKTVGRLSEARLLLVGRTRLTIIERNGQWWHTESICFDEIVVEKIDGDLIIGLALVADEEPVVFCYDIRQKVLVGGVR